MDFLSSNTHTASIRSSRQIIDKKSLDEEDKASGKKIIQETKTKLALEAQGIDLEQQEHERVIKTMLEEEQPKIQIPVEDVQNLILSLQTQRNTALTQVAVEQARVKTLLSIIEKQKQTISNQASSL